MAQEGLQELFSDKVRGVGGPVVGTCGVMQDLEFGVLWIRVSAVESLPGGGFAGDLLVASVLMSRVLGVGVSVRMRMVVVLMGASAVGRSASRTPSTLDLVVIATGVLGCGAHGIGEHGTEEPRTKEPGAKEPG